MLVGVQCRIRTNRTELPIQLSSGPRWLLCKIIERQLQKSPLGLFLLRSEVTLCICMCPCLRAHTWSVYVCPRYLTHVRLGHALRCSCGAISCLRCSHCRSMLLTMLSLLSCLSYRQVVFPDLFSDISSKSRLSFVLRLYIGVAVSFGRGRVERHAYFTDPGANSNMYTEKFKTANVRYDKVCRCLPFIGWVSIKTKVRQRRRIERSAPTSRRTQRGKDHQPLIHSFTVHL